MCETIPYKWFYIPHGYSCFLVPHLSLSHYILHIYCLPMKYFQIITFSRIIILAVSLNPCMLCFFKCYYLHGWAAYKALDDEWPYDYNALGCCQGVAGRQRGVAWTNRIMGMCMRKLESERETERENEMPYCQGVILSHEGFVYCIITPSEICLFRDALWQCAVLRNGDGLVNYII